MKELLDLFTAFCVVSVLAGSIFTIICYLNGHKMLYSIEEGIKMIVGVLFFLAVTSLMLGATFVVVRGSLKLIFGV